MWKRGKVSLAAPLDASKQRLWYGLSVSFSPESLSINSDTQGTLTVQTSATGTVTDVVAVILAPDNGFDGSPDQSGRPRPSDPHDALTQAALYLEDKNSQAVVPVDYVTFAGGNFNDRVMPLTRGELMRRVEKRVLGDAAIALEKYRSDYGRYPWLSPFLDPRNIVGTATGGSSTQLNDTARINTPGDFSLDHFSDVGVLSDYLVLNLTDGSNGRASSTGSTTVTLTVPLTGGTNNTFSVGDEYEIRPPFNGSWNTREGHIPFIDLSNNESFDFPTGFTANWEGVGAANCFDPQLPDRTLDIGPPDQCTKVTDSLTLLATSTMTVQPPTVGDGECTWTDSLDPGSPQNVVSCRGTATQPDVYDVRIIRFGIPTDYPVTRTYTFDFNYTGIGSAPAGGANGVKTRDVVSNTLDQTVTIEDTILDVTLGVLTVGRSVVTVPPSQLTMSGIYYDIEDNLDGVSDANEHFEPYFFPNDWHHYIYVSVSADDVSGGDGDCAGPPINCVTLDVEAALAVRTDIRALLVSAGPDLGAAGGQDRNDDDPITSITLADYFEGTNNTEGDNTFVRSRFATTFNDQVRVVGPNPP